jgi:hypothetical protein
MHYFGSPRSQSRGRFSRVDGLCWRWLDPGRERDRRDWMALLERCHHDFHQLPAYVELEARRLGGRAAALLIERRDDVALLPLVVRALPEALGLAGVDASSPYGYPAPVFCTRQPEFASAAIAAMVTALRERGVVTAFVRLHPLLELPLDACARWGTIEDHGPTVWIDLEADERSQWADYRSTHRNLIRRAEREGLRVRFDAALAQRDAFYSVYEQTMIRVDASWADFDRAYLDGFAAALGERAFLALVEHEQEIIAGGLFTRCDGIVQYHLSGTATAWQHASPSRLMLDQVRRRCAALGDRRLHLGGGVGAREDALFRFKRGFSSQRGRFRSWRLIVDPRAHEQLLARWRALGGDPVQAGEFFPRYRAPLHACALEQCS